MLLAQQELLEPGPTRRLIVPAGHCSWWGVDTSVARVAVAWVDMELRRGVLTVSLPSLAGGQRLAYAFEEIRDRLRDEVSAGRVPVPGLVLVEQPSGKQQNLPLSYMVGVVQAAVFAGAVAGGAVVLGGVAAPRVETCTSSWWKRRACGYGAIYKPKRGEDRQYGVLVWARDNGYGGASWDEADAWAMAEAARREVALDAR